MMPSTAQAEVARPPIHTSPAQDRLFAQVRIGAHILAVRADAVLHAMHLPTPPQPIPRRGGAIIGVCPSRWGLLPVIDLARWLDLGPADAAGLQVLVLRAQGKVVAVQVSALGGVRPVAGLRRLHQDDDPEELFQCAVQWPDGSVASLLEVDRLARLAIAWCAESDLEILRADTVTAAPSDQRLIPHALLRAGGRVWALPAPAVLQVVPALPLELTLQTGSAVRGICAWQGRKMPVVDLAALQRAGAMPTPGTLMALVSNGPLCIAVVIEAVERMAGLPDDEDGAAHMLQPCLLPDLGEVMRVHVGPLLAALPEAGISRAPVHPAKRSTPQSRRPDHPPRSASPHLLFECGGATFASPVAPVLRVLTLEPSLAARLVAGDAATIAFEGQAIPLVALPSFNDTPAPAPTVALVVGLQDGGRAAIGVHRMSGWADAGTAQTGSLRTPVAGDMQTVTLTRSGVRSTHMVVDLREVAQVLA